MYSKETRQHTLGLLDEGYEPVEVSGIMGCSERSLRRWLAHMRPNGTVWADHALRNSHKSAAARNPALTYATLELVVSEPVAIFLRTS